MYQEVLLLELNWVIIILIAIGVIYNLITGEREEEERKEKVNKFLQDLKFQIRVTEQTITKNESDGLPPGKYFNVEMKGLFGHPTESNTKAILTITDNTDSEKEDDFGLMVLSAHPFFMEKQSRVFNFSHVYENTTSDTYFPEWSRLILIPQDILILPMKGKRRLKFNLTMSDDTTEVKHAGYDDLDKIKGHAYALKNFTFKEIGYVEEVGNKSIVQDLTIKLCMAMAATDDHLDQKELNVIKDWAKSLSDELEPEAAKEKKEHFKKIIKESYKEAKEKKLSISNLVKELNDKAGKAHKYLAIQLLLDVAASDSKLAAEEEKFINKIAKTINIDVQTFKGMKDKIIANVENIEFSERPSEESFGLTEDMSNEEKCKALRKEYTKWNGQTAHKDPKKKKRAKEMVKIIADLRKQYNC